MKGANSSPLAVFVGIGFEIVALILVAVWLGGHLDRHFALAGLGTVFMIILAMVAWMVHVFVLLKQLNQKQNQPPTDEK